MNLSSAAGHKPLAGRRPLRRDQGGGRVADAIVGARARTARRPRERGRAGPDGDPRLREAPEPRDGAAVREAFVKNVPLGRMAEPDEVARWILARRRSEQDLDDRARARDRRRDEPDLRRRRAANGLGAFCPGRRSRRRRWTHQALARTELRATRRRWLHPAIGDDLTGHLRAKPARSNVGERCSRSGASRS